jgi:hypothetical protein
MTSLERIEDERISSVKGLEDRAVRDRSGNGRQFLADEPLEYFDAGHLCRSGDQLLAGTGAFGAK